MRQPPDFYDDDDLELVYVSARLAEAKRVEGILTAEDIHYVVQPEKYRATFLFVFPTERIGAFFYVRPKEARRCRALLGSHGLPVTD